MKTKKRNRIPEELWKPLYQQSSLNKVWSKIGDYNRECLLCKGSISFPSQRVLGHHNELIVDYECQKIYKNRQRSEFTSGDYKKWCKVKGIDRVYS